MMTGDQVTVLVGAGFSHAINPIMPLTNAAGEQIVGNLDASDRDQLDRLGGDFERLLSRLAEPQPDLDIATIATNRGRFYRMSTLIAELIEHSQRAAVATPLPAWLAGLMHAWHLRRAQVISFNYDTLIEQAANELRLFDWQSGAEVHGDDVIDRLPPYPPGPARFGPGSMPGTMRLLKLHGSLEWYATPEDLSGATLARLPLRTGWRPIASGTPDERRRQLPGRERFVIPPTSAKSGWYHNPLLRQLWHDAGEALELAHEIHIIGYSLPATDLVTRAMLAGRSNRHAKWIVVNPDPQRIVDEITSMAVPLADVTVVGSVSEYAQMMVARHANEASARFTEIAARAGARDLAVLAWSRDHAYRITAPSGGNGCLRLGDTGPQPIDRLLSTPGAEHLTVQQLQHLLATKASTFKVDVGGQELSITQVVEAPPSGELGRDHLVLVPAGASPAKSSAADDLDFGD